jgi:PIN domain nuclease of toxin-antitoxin system
MKILLDTHVWIWSQEKPEKLGPATRDAVGDESNGLVVSSVSSLEMARLVWGGRLSLAGRLQTWIDSALDALLADTIPLTHEIALAAYDLPGEFHRDPVDRMLVATARVHDLTLATADERILAYPHVLSLNALE